jgi:AraC family transcriptional regulator
MLGRYRQPCDYNFSPNPKTTMLQLKRGSFFGLSKQKKDYNGLIIADIEYPAPIDVPWHYHENPYFTYFIKGHLLEVNKKESYTCIPGTLVFHNWQEPHYNTKHSDYIHFFHTELDKKWFERHQLDLSVFEGSKVLDNPDFRALFNRIYKEFHINDSASEIAVEGMMLQVFGKMERQSEPQKKIFPAWVAKARELIHDQCSESLSLELLSHELGMNPTYLSQIFPKYFRANFGEYIRIIRVDKATSLLSHNRLTLTQIAYDCGFSDQSHFIRCFKQINGMTPAQYRKIVLRY